MLTVQYTLFFVSVAVSLAYAGMQLYFVRTWEKMPDFSPKTPDAGISGVNISVLIPARNEAANISNLLRSILQANHTFNLLEIIVLDDFSEDETAALAMSFPFVRVIKMADVLPSAHRSVPNKKTAISIGVKAAQGDVVLTTDADCIVPPQWLHLTGSAFTQNPELQALSGPVAFETGDNLLYHFQALDFSGMMGITGAGYFSHQFCMANGANFAYRKSAFEAVAGFEGNMHIASGDDMFLMQKLALRFPDGVGFLKHPEATVLTPASPDWMSFWQQRLRWGSKNTALSNSPMRLALAVAFLNCCLLLLLLVCSLFSASSMMWLFFFLVLAIKAWSDHRLLASLCKWFGREHLMRWFWPSFMMHILYISGIGTASLFYKSYTWKGRKG